MTDDTSRKREAAAAFDESASEYLESDVHRAGDDLAQLASWCSEANRALDVATGAGHTAGAIADQGVEHVVATDAAPKMVETATTEFNIAGVVSDAERLPFADGSFDAVACRIAAHHFPNPEAFVEDVARVTADGGVFALEDNVAPAESELDAFLNEVERLRDPTHVRSHTESEWRQWLTEAGFDVEERLLLSKEIDYRDWVRQLETPAENRAQLREAFADPPAGASELFDITYEDGELVSFSNLKLLVLARR
ncbi:class I SAM-dependent methyltransferase [Natrialba sp. INN-245]|uniref:class I SAM-dependent methyltransferase n=1 Tax=Natrialba sp. INN-245 TaxID=2690967 RepID=UPI0013120A54|nr:class I SAM-dependent methyltransferase [Natrialba sp. INN-245]MWV38448.1 methyltransferase domain-containing protein [Natrialba sp. INN-245]